MTRNDARAAVFLIQVWILLLNFTCKICYFTYKICFFTYKICFFTCKICSTLLIQYALLPTAMSRMYVYMYVCVCVCVCVCVYNTHTHTGGGAALGKLTRAQIEKGQAVLLQVRQCLEGGGKVPAALTNSFYRCVCVCVCMCLCVYVCAHKQLLQVCVCALTNSSCRCVCVYMCADKQLLQPHPHGFRSSQTSVD